MAGTDTRQTPAVGSEEDEEEEEGVGRCVKEGWRGFKEQKVRLGLILTVCEGAEAFGWWRVFSED